MSLRHCETLFPLFGVDSKEKLIEIIHQNKPDCEVKYDRAWECAPTVMNSIKIEDIATLP